MKAYRRASEEEFPVKFCKDCSQVYELFRKDTIYHADFPTYGLERENCNNCK